MSDIHPPGPRTKELCIAAWQRLQAAIEADPDLAADEQGIAAQYDVDPTILRPDELLRRMMRALVTAIGREEQCRNEAQIVLSQQLRYAKWVARLRADLFEVMQALERRTYPSPYGTVSIKAGVPSLLLTDEQALPREYIIEKVVRTPDRHRIAADLKAGKQIRGAVLSNPMPVLAVRLAKPVEEEQEQEAADPQ